MAIGHRLKRRALALAATSAVALVLLAVLIAGCGGATSAEEGTQTSGGSGSLLNVIVVSGTGQVTTLPDKATIQVSTENDGSTAAEALDANSQETQKVLDRLKAEGVADKAIETANVVVYPNRYYDPETGQEKTVGYRAQNSITVTFEDFTLMAKVFAAVTEAGADNVYGPSWQLSEDNPAVLTALTKAVENARIKAEAIATAQGVELGEAIIISEGSSYVPSPMYEARAAVGAGTDSAVMPPPISPENMEVTASVTVTYPMNR
jgi:uncharacterized protein YggE